MKGIAHFLTGVALATCFPEIVALAREGSLLPVMGGIGGLLPDVLDFRFVRYFERYDVEIDPAALVVGGSAPGTATDGSTISGAAGAAFVVDALVDVIRTACATGEPRSVIVHTLRLGHDLWRRYTIRLDPEANALAVCFGPLVTTGGVTLPGTELPDSVWVARTLDVPVVHDYSREYHVDAFTGPSFRFVPQQAEPDQSLDGDRGLAMHFLDWHHRWTHSLPLALAVGVGVGLLVMFFFGSHVGGWAGLLTALGFVAHVLEDQLGHMGSNLFWPFTHRRQPGIKLLHASDAVPNFLTTWTSLALILLNLDRFGAAVLPVRLYVFCALVLPWLVLGVDHVARRRRGATPSVGADALREAERLAELQGIGDG